MADNEGIGGAVASHYNNLQEAGLDQRKDSRIFHMRNFNNWIKSMLINEYSRKIHSSKSQSRDQDRRDREDGGQDLRDSAQNFNVLDIGCGKGGDLQKWGKARVNHYVGVDIAQTSVEQAKDRYSGRRCNFSADFFAADCTKTDLDPLYKDKNVTFDIVSCQFAFHYCFESVEQADCMLRNITRRLKKGGYFIGTTTDANDIVARVRAQNNSNSVFGINFDPPLSEEDPPPIFGAKYNFHLEGVVDCPEFLVHFNTFIKLAERHGLTLICKRRFDRYFESVSNILFSLFKLNPRKDSISYN